MNDYEILVKERMDKFHRYLADRTLVQAAQADAAPRRKLLVLQALSRAVTVVLTALR